MFGSEAFALALSSTGATEASCSGFRRPNDGKCSWNQKMGSRCRAQCPSKVTTSRRFVLNWKRLTCLGPRVLANCPDRQSPPCFPTEFREACENKSWPEGLEPDKAWEFLLNGYLAATELRWQRTLSEQHSPQTSRTCFDGLKIGDVLPEQRKQHDFHHFRTNFSNSPPNKISISANSVYVTVGFNDLRVLLDASIQEEATNIHFVGIDLNDFAVAKTLVIAAMLNDASIAVNEVLQVWYSSTWSRGTFSSFKRTVLALKPPAQKPGIRRLVDFWKSTAAPDLTRCRQEWLQYFASDARKWDACTIASLVRQQDRLAACRYFLTGDVWDEREESADQLEVGSITMWALPFGSLPLHNADSIFATMNLEDYLPVSDEAGSIVQLFVNDICKKLNSIRQLLVEGRLEIEIWQDELTLDSCQLISQISALSPAAISWSNLLTTQTLLHSMLWQQGVPHQAHLLRTTPIPWSG